jgi:hypothetical protein
VPLVDQGPHLGEEERHQERGDMRAVHIGVGHDDDLVVAQILDVELRAHADAQRLAEVGDLGVLAELGRRRAQHVQDLAPKRQERLRLAVPRHLGRAARAVALDDEQLRPVAGLLRSSRRACRAGAVSSWPICAPSPSPARRRRRSSARSTRKSRIEPAALVFAASQLSKWSRTAASTMRAASVVARRSLVWPTNSGSAMKQETSAQPPPVRSSRVMLAAFLLPTSSP